MIRKMLSFLWVACLLLVSIGAPVQGQANSTLTADFEAEIANAWFALQLKLVRETPGFSPPVAARAFGYTGVTLYEAVVPGMPDYQTLVGQLNELEGLPQPESGVEYSWAAVANSALANITERLFASASDENKAAIESLYDQFADEFQANLDPDTLNRSVTQGRVIADAIYIWSLTDGGHEAYSRNFPTDYVAPVGTGLWVPTPQLNGGDPQPALQPYWGNNRTFVLRPGEECAISAPPEYSETQGSDFYDEAMEVYETVNGLTEEQMAIARFWADDPGATSTPAGHSISLLTQVLRQESATLATAAEGYAKLGIAIADAFIGCWHAKFEYNLVRPVTYINQTIDPDWLPPVNTPPFPEYPSGHSVQSGAAAQVLTDLFGDEYTFTDHTHDDRDYSPRTFNSFFDFAEEAAISRLYGGIHYRSAIEIGLEQGRCIGERVSQLHFQSNS